ncbi:Sir2 histone deacetylase Hst2 [Ceratobasidium sp. 414]|nr:Sir2 histone deacetylase Hst2 [Ceratobasidium sp. 414]
MQSNLLARLAAIMRRQQQQQRDLTVEDDSDDEHYTMTSDEIEVAQELFWRRIADPHGDGGTVPRGDPKVLDTCDLAGVANYIKGSPGYGDGKRKVVVMVGAGKSIPMRPHAIRLNVLAGISTSAGIPDFRSPKTGLYANLARLNLPYPEAVFDISFFRENPLPFYTLAHELYPGRFRPTVTHSFIKLLADKDMLHMCFTQNIDTLERLAGVPESKLVEAHGSFADNHCIDCGAEFPRNKMRELVMARNLKTPDGINVPRCLDPKCKGLIKPDIVFFGESLPARFHSSISQLPFADIALVLGTSLAVHPFARLPEMVSDRCPRVLMNMEAVGHFKRADDVVHLAPCDDAVRELCDLLGWRDELEATWAATENLVVSAGAPSNPPSSVLGTEAESSKVQAAKNRVESGGMKDLAQMLAGGLKLEDQAETNADAKGKVGKGKETVAERSAEAIATAFEAGPTKSPISQPPTASIRVSLAWQPHPAPVPDEESVLVLTAPSGHYVDIRIRLPASATNPGDFSTTTSTTTAPASLAPTNDPSVIPSGSTLSWAFAGLASRTLDGKGGRWSRLVDSQTPTPAGEVDEGQEESLPNGDTKETGVMGGREYVEVWRPLDVGREPDVWVAVREGGVVVRVGGWAQGVTRQGEGEGVLSAFRARLGQADWEDIWRVGNAGVFPKIGGTGDGWKVLNGGETEL